MALNLETLRKEMQEFLEHSGTPIFYGSHRMLDSLVQIGWDTKRHPDFREFLSAAQKAGVKLIVFNEEAFDLQQIDQALQDLENADISREEKRNLESRLNQLERYEGFTCVLQLSFCLEGHVYLYEAITDWYESLGDILSELEAVIDPFPSDEGEEHGPIGGNYFSNN